MNKDNNNALNDVNLRITRRFLMLIFLPSITYMLDSFPALCISHVWSDKTRCNFTCTYQSRSVTQSACSIHCDAPLTQISSPVQI